MKQEISYKCKRCSTAFSCKDIFKQCKKSRRVSKEIKSCRYYPIMCNQAGYPDRITVVFDDGETVTYYNM